MGEKNAKRYTRLHPGHDDAVSIIIAASKERLKYFRHYDSS